jgi:hypothetical protein
LTAVVGDGVVGVVGVVVVVGVLAVVGVVAVVWAGMLDGVVEPSAAARLGTRPETAIAAVRDVIESARRRRMARK